MEIPKRRGRCQNNLAFLRLSFGVYQTNSVKCTLAQAHYQSGLSSSTMICVFRQNHTETYLVKDQRRGDQYFGVPFAIANLLTSAT